MPDETRYYYWNEGGDVQGPHPPDKLRQLYGEAAIGTQTQLCPEGGTVWQPFDLGLILPPVRTTPPPPPPKPERWTGTNWWNRDTTGSHIGRKIFTGVAWLIMVLCAVIYIWGQRLIAPASIPWSPILVSALSFLFVMLLVIPFVLTILLPRWLRSWCRSSLIILLSFFVFVAAVGAFGSQVQLREAFRTLNHKGKEMIESSVEMDRTIPSLDPVNLKSMEDLTQAETAMLKLRGSFSDVADFFATYDQQARDALAPLNLYPNKVSESIATAHKDARIDELLPLWQLKVKLSDDQISRLSFLEKNWGHWTVRNDQVIFEDGTLVDPYNILHAAVLKDVADFNDLKKKFDAATPADK